MSREELKKTGSGVKIPITFFFFVFCQCFVNDNIGTFQDFLFFLFKSNFGNVFLDDDLISTTTKITNTVPKR
jgi:hypothetical protein